MKTTHTLPLLLGLIVANTTFASPQSVDWDDRQIFAHSNQDGPIRSGLGDSLFQDLSWLDRPIAMPAWVKDLGIAPSIGTQPHLFLMDVAPPSWSIDNEPQDMLATLRKQHAADTVSPHTPFDAPLHVPGPGPLTLLGLGLVAARRRRR
jgi:hypothetical protein